MPTIPIILRKIKRRSSERKKRLEKRIRSSPGMSALLPPQRMRELVNNTRRMEQSHQKELRKIGESVLTKLFGHQAIELIMDKEGFEEIPSEGPKHQPITALSANSRRILRSLQRSRSISEGLGLIAQEMYLTELKKQKPELFQKLIQYYNPFMAITQLGFHYPVPPGAAAMGLGRGEARIKYVKIQNKQDPTDVRVIPAESWGNVLNAPTVLLWVNEAAEVLTILNLKKAQQKLTQISEAERGEISTRLHSLQLRNLRYQQGQHFFKIANPIFERIAGKNAKRPEDRAGLVRRYWDNFLSLPTTTQDTLLNDYFSAKTSEEKGVAIQEIEQKINGSKRFS